MAAQSERGSVSMWTSVSVVAMLLFVGLVVDFGGQVHAQQQARDVAAQAARAGGQQVDAAMAVRGDGVRADPARAQAAAAAFLAASDVDGSVSVVGGNRLVVTTSNTYRTKFLSLVGVTTLPAKGEAEARMVRVVGGVEQ